MFKSFTIIFSVIFFMAAAGCQTTSGNIGGNPLISVNQIPPEQAVVITVCRPKSVMRFGDTPDFEVNGVVVGEIKNGSRIEFILKPGDKFKVNLPKNYLMQRYSDSLIFEGSADKPGRVYLLLSTNWEIDVEAGIDTLFFGSITAGVWQKMREPDQNWFIKPIEPTAFEQNCK